jgi:hypothetical protein
MLFAARYAGNGPGVSVHAINHPALIVAANKLMTVRALLFTGEAST